MLPEYRFDYRKAKRNRFARGGVSRVVVVLDPDIAEVFRTPESVNVVLRALMTTMPRDSQAGESFFTENLSSLRTEIQGRVASGLGFILGELSITPGELEPVDSLRLEEAIEQCWQGYNTLKGFGAAELMALNNLIYCLASQGDHSYREFVLDKARELKETGEKHDNPRLLLTYCRAILRYGGSEEELNEMRNIAGVIAASRKFPQRLRREAKLYLRSEL
jgi:hypothetical protein